MATDSTAEVKSHTAARPKAEPLSPPPKRNPDRAAYGPVTLSEVERLRAYVAELVGAAQEATRAEEESRRKLQVDTGKREAIGRKLQRARHLLREAKTADDSAIVRKENF